MSAAVLLILTVALVLGTTGSNNVVVRSEINQDIEPLQRSILLLRRDNDFLRAHANQTSRKLSIENAALKTSVERLERKLAALAGHSPKATGRLADAGVAVEAPPKPAAAAASSAAPAALTSIEFTRERAHQIATNGCLLLTFVNKIRLDFATTWVHHVRRLGMTNWLVGATDKPSLKELQLAGIPTFDMATHLPEGEWPWGSASFKSLGAWAFRRSWLEAFSGYYSG